MFFLGIAEFYCLFQYLREDSLERENARLYKEVDRIKGEHRIAIEKQSKANSMLIKEYKEQNMILQHQVVDSKSMETKKTAPKKYLQRDETLNR